MLDLREDFLPLGLERRIGRLGFWSYFSKRFCRGLENGLEGRSKLFFVLGDRSFPSNPLPNEDSDG